MWWSNKIPELSLPWRSGFLGLLSCLLLPVAGYSVALEKAGGYTDQQILAYGKAIYRKGLLPDGTAVKASFGTGAPVPEQAVACANCHKRSGLGAVEGNLIVWPVNAASLFSPRRTTGAWRASVKDDGPGSRSRWHLPVKFDSQAARPAYTQETLARMIRTGVDASGRHTSMAMPRYDLSDEHMAMLMQYLAQLSPDQEFSPGVNKQSIRFGVVVDSRVSQRKKEAMLKVLKSVTKAHNTQTRPHIRRAAKGPFYKTEAYGAYRQIELVVWELTGEEESWRAQLEDYQEESPVFALLGGISATTWQPIHEFCEEHEIPAILPLTREPVISDSDWYTLYFSKEHYQEGDVTAQYLARSGQPPAGAIVQLYRPGTPGENSARGFSNRWSAMGREQGKLENVVLDVPVSTLPWEKILGDMAPGPLLVWLEGEDLRQFLTVMQSLHPGEEGLGDIYLSADALKATGKTLSQKMRRKVMLVSSHSPQGEFVPREQALKRWLKVQGIDYSEPEIQAKMYFIGWILPGALKHMRGEYYRDYFMESFEMMGDQYHSIASYPRLSFSPGQRYLAKGGYILRLLPGRSSGYRKVVDWQVEP